MPLGLFAIDTAAAFARGWSPLGSRLDLAALIAALVLAVLLAVAWYSPTVHRAAPIGPRVVAVWVSLVFALLAGELLLSFASESIDRAPFHRHPRGLRQVFEPKIPGTSPRARFSVNSQGLRGTEPPGDTAVRRLLFVGGSTTEDVYLDDERTWTLRLPELLNARGGDRFWAASAGRSGFASIEHLEFLEHADVVSEFDVVIVLLGINDMARLVWGERADRIALNRAKVRAPLWRRSRTLELIRRFWSAGVEQGNLVMDREALFVRDAQTRRSEAKVVDGEIDIAPALGDYERRLSRLVMVTRRRGLKLVLADQPTLFRTDLSPEEERRLWFIRRADGDFLPARRMLELMKSFNDVTASVATRMDVPFVRLSEMTGASDYFYDDCHFSEVGAEEVARRLSERIDWQGLLTGDSSSSTTGDSWSRESEEANGSI